jgi:hypothetical protein
MPPAFPGAGWQRADLILQSMVLTQILLVLGSTVGVVPARHCGLCHLLIGQALDGDARGTAAALHHQSLPSLSGCACATGDAAQ